MGYTVLSPSKCNTMHGLYSTESIKIQHHAWAIQYTVHQNATPCMGYTVQSPSKCNTMHGLYSTESIKMQHHAWAIQYRVHQNATPCMGYTVLSPSTYNPTSCWSLMGLGWLKVIIGLLKILVNGADMCIYFFALLEEGKVLILYTRYNNVKMDNFFFVPRVPIPLHHQKHGLVPPKPIKVKPCWQCGREESPCLLQVMGRRRGDKCMIHLNSVWMGWQKALIFLLGSVSENIFSILLIFKNLELTGYRPGISFL